jgi:hypothetical protein
LVDTLDLVSSAFGRVGSNPSSGTNNQTVKMFERLKKWFSGKSKPVYYRQTAIPIYDEEQFAKDLCYRLKCETIDLNEISYYAEHDTKEGKKYYRTLSTINDLCVFCTPQTFKCKLYHENSFEDIRPVVCKLDGMFWYSEIPGTYGICPYILRDRIEKLTKK